MATVSELRAFDRVKYVGPMREGSGEPSFGVPDLRHGEQGSVIDVLLEGEVVVAFDDFGAMCVNVADLIFVSRPDA